VLFVFLFLFRLKLKIMNIPAYPLTLLYDGRCRVCSLEMDELHAQDSHQRLRFEDISAPGFDAAPWGATAAELDALMHAVDAAGRTCRGVPALRLAYTAVGRGQLWTLTAWPLLEPLFNAGYAWFARNRHGISHAAAPLIEHIAAARAARRIQRCADGVCAGVEKTRRPS
jgi:predicted DCC family thiol-disulfide oxidoreductase YuxK